MISKIFKKVFCCNKKVLDLNESFLPNEVCIDIEVDEELSKFRNKFVNAV